MKIKITSLFKAGLYFCLIWDTLLLSMFNFQMGGKRYSIMFAIAAFLTLLVFTNKNRMQLVGQSIKWPKTYFFLVCIMLFLHMIYAVILKGVSFEAFIHNAWYYLMCIWAFPLIYILKKDSGEEKFWKVINIIMLVWYSWLLIEYIAYQYAGIVLSPAILESVRGVRIRNDAIRLEMKALAHIAIIYNFDKFYNQIDRKNKIWHLVMALYGIAIMLIVEQTRGYFIAIFGAMAVLIMCYNKKTIKFFASALIILIAVCIALKVQLLSSFLDILFSTAESGVTGATGLIRARGMTAFWNQFINNPLFGYGFQETGDFATTASGIFYFNDDGFLGIVGQIGIWAFIIYGTMIFRFGYIVNKLFKEKNYKQGTLLLGLYIYMLLTSISLICYWNTTCLLCPILWALFEVGYDESRINSDSNKYGKTKMRILR